MRYDTGISNEGTNISGGEKQRIILARALLNNFQILILDEALSEVDYSLEEKIMSFTIVHQDITTMKTEAIVNAANSRLLQGGGVCGAIFQAAGAEKMQAACDEIGFCTVGEAVITPGFDLAAQFVIHTVGPVWKKKKKKEAELLSSAYRNSLLLAKENNIKSIAFPLLSAGIFGYPKDEARTLAEKTILAFLSEHEMSVYLVLFDG